MNTSSLVSELCCSIDPQRLNYVQESFNRRCFHLRKGVVSYNWDLRFSEYLLMGTRQKHSDDIDEEYRVRRRRLINALQSLDKKAIEEATAHYLEEIQ